MYWTTELISHLNEAPFPATKEELIDYADRSGAPDEVIENLGELSPDVSYDSIEEVWPECPQNGDFFYDEDEY